MRPLPSSSINIPRVRPVQPLSSLANLPYEIQSRIYSGPGVAQRMRGVSATTRSVAQAPFVQRESESFDPTPRELALLLSRGEVLSLIKIGPTTRIVTLSLKKDNTGLIHNNEYDRSGFNIHPTESTIPAPALGPLLKLLAQYVREGFNTVEIDALSAIFKDRIQYFLQDPQYPVKQILRVITRYLGEIRSQIEPGIPGDYISEAIPPIYRSAGIRAVMSLNYWLKLYSRNFSLSSFDEYISKMYIPQLIKFLTSTTSEEEGGEEGGEEEEGRDEGEGREED